METNLEMKQQHETFERATADGCGADVERIAGKGTIQQIDKT